MRYPQDRIAPDPTGGPIATIMAPGAALIGSAWLSGAAELAGKSLWEYLERIYENWWKDPTVEPMGRAATIAPVGYTLHSSDWIGWCTGGVHTNQWYYYSFISQPGLFCYNFGQTLSAPTWDELDHSFWPWIVFYERKNYVFWSGKTRQIFERHSVDPPLRWPNFIRDPYYDEFSLGPAPVTHQFPGVPNIQRVSPLQQNTRPFVPRVIPFGSQARYVVAQALEHFDTIGAIGSSRGNEAPPISVASPAQVAAQATKISGIAQPAKVVEQRTAPPLAIVGPTSRAVPEPGTKEAKIHVTMFGSTITAQVFGAITEVLDLIDCLYAGVPSKLKPNFDTPVDGALNPQDFDQTEQTLTRIPLNGFGLNSAQKAQVVFDTFGQLDLQGAVAACLSNQLIDAAGGLVGKGVAATSRGLGLPVGIQRLKSVLVDN